jgi:hypothetical protein
MASTSGISSPVTPTESNAPQANRFSFFGRLARQPRGSVVLPGAPTDTAIGSAVDVPSVAPVVPSTPAPVQISSPIVEQVSPDHAAELSKLKVENAQLRCRNIDLTQQSELNQLMLQECISSSKSEVHGLTKEIAKLKQSDLCSNLKVECLTDVVEKLKVTIEDATKQRCQRCGDLTIQSDLNQSLVQACNANMQVKDRQIANLSARLSAQINESKGLQLLGFTQVPAGNPSALQSRIEILEADKLSLQASLDVQVSKNRELARTYGEELDSLTDDWRNASTDAKYFRKQIAMWESSFRTLHAEYTHLTGELHSERTANKKLVAPAYTKGNKSATDLARHNSLLFTQLTKTEALAAERQEIIDDFKATHKHFEAQAKAGLDESIRQNFQIEDLHAGNKADRTDYEATLQAKDARIKQLKQAFNAAQAVAHSVPAAVDVETQVQARVEAMRLGLKWEAERRVEVLEERLREMKEEDMEREGLSRALVGIVVRRKKTGSQASLIPTTPVLGTSQVVVVQTVPRSPASSPTQSLTAVPSLSPSSSCSSSNVSHCVARHTVRNWCNSFKYQARDGN